MSEVIQVEPEAAEAQAEASDAEALIDTVAERWGYYLGKRTTQSALMQATTTERASVRVAGKSIKDKIADYLKNGTDVRDEVNSMQEDLEDASEILSEKAKPFYEKISPLNKALTYLDRVVIPMQIERATGEKLLPKLQVTDYTQKAIDAATASK